MSNPIMRYFAYNYLPRNLQDVPREIKVTADFMNDFLPDGAEKSAGLRKLLEAKDCFVRAELDKVK